MFLPWRPPTARAHATARLGRGRRGERLAARRLRRLGYRVLARNVRIAGVEIDLLAEEGGLLVLVEVKTVGSAPPADLRRLLRAEQAHRLAVAARSLARRQGLRGPGGAPVRIRFDLAVVSLDGGRPVVTIRRDAWRDRTRT